VDQQPANQESIALWQRAWGGVFSVWLIIFYVIWVLLIVNCDKILDVFSHWPVSLAMAGGSMVAGSSPVAGGTVGFPMLVYFSQQPPTLGKYFCVAIQSVGMLSASIYILMKNRAVHWRALQAAMLGSAIWLPIAMAFLAPGIGDRSLKILFAVMYGAFGLIHLVYMRWIVSNHRNTFPFQWIDFVIFFVAGMLAGTLTAFLGVGPDIVLYCTLVFFYRCDIKQAIPTATLFMAFNSIVAVVVLLVMARESIPVRGSLQAMYYYWLAVAPVVVLGAPVGSMISRKVPRIYILWLVGILCTFQCIWTCTVERLGTLQVAVIAMSVLLLSYALHYLVAPSMKRNAEGTIRNEP
jgi:uncharacterized membrane protein YfcA